MRYTIGILFSLCLLTTGLSGATLKGLLQNNSAALQVSDLEDALGYIIETSPNGIHWSSFSPSRMGSTTPWTETLSVGHSAQFYRLREYEVFAPQDALQFTELEELVFDEGELESIFSSVSVSLENVTDVAFDIVIMGRLPAQFLNITMTFSVEYTYDLFDLNTIYVKMTWIDTHYKGYFRNNTDERYDPFELANLAGEPAPYYFELEFNYTASNYGTTKSDMYWTNGSIDTETITGPIE